MHTDLYITILKINQSNWLIFLFLFIFYLYEYIYPPDSQESDGGANT